MLLADKTTPAPGCWEQPESVWVQGEPGHPLGKETRGCYWVSGYCLVLGGPKQGAFGGSGVTPAVGVCGRRRQDQATFPGEPLQALFPWELRGITVSQFTEFLKSFSDASKSLCRALGQDRGPGQLHTPHPPQLQPRGEQRCRRRISPAVRVSGRSGQHNPAQRGTGDERHLPPSDHHQLPKAGRAQAVTKHLSSPAALPGSSGCTKSAINPSRCAAFCTISSLPPPSSAQDRLHGADVPPPAPVPLPGFAFAWMCSRPCGASMEPASAGSTALNAEGECKAGSASGLGLVSQLQKRWVSPD